MACGTARRPCGGRTRTSNPSPAIIGRHAVGHQPRMAADDALCASGNGLHLPHRNDDRRMLPPAAFVARAENRAVTIPWTMARATPAFGRSRSEEHTSELQSLKRNSYAVFCLK